MNTRIHLRQVFCLALCLPLLSALLSGCWDDRELNELGITSGSAYDWENNQWKATYQVINPSSGASGMGGSGGGSTSSPPFLTFTVKGNTIMEAIERTNLTSTREMFFSHSRITVIGESLAKHGINQLLDMFLRKQDARETVYVFIAKGDAGDILDQLMQMTKNQGAGIQLMIEQESRLLSYYPGTRLFELAMALSSESGAATLPEILLTGPEIMDETSETGITDLPSRLALGRLGVIKGEKFAGWLNQRQAFGLSFLTDNIKTATIAFASRPQTSDKLDASFVLQNSTTTVRPVWTKDHYIMDVDIKGSGILSELGSVMDLNDRAAITEMEDSLEQQVLELVNASWSEVKKLGADVTGFAVRIHRSDRKRWKQIEKEKSWESVFQEIEIRPHVSFQIERTGLSNKSFKSVQQE
ncbi:Ger(x)C family spore germination protein [Paenibacillus sp. MMS20-IR301]|uniref:Ger(x)C family spore germination protein n=1 Tax=Paenibacillus sp. MMS20-IR301 TaxID=2895946 RepID=UPI0028E6587A|nr:Ger(x)C family spore germination protein [Paenibacillus sp. MMS20-IR301]WNS41165.1 Ger(x)C family spore germination protein [Paenibacillus sp. MMS20-IR301]